MNVTFAYLGHSRLIERDGARLLSLAPNLSREPVALDAPLTHPLHFREAISALHDVVVSDLRYQPRDKTAYEEWKKQNNARLAEIRRQAYSAATKQIEARRNQPLPANFEQEYRRETKRYWDIRLKYSSLLQTHDMELWRQLVPCDPIITVAEDVVFFECFSADESSYGCLSVNREESFGRSGLLQLGTTNVDYSWDLYNSFQSLRTYRETRFKVDPQGFEVATQGNQDYREEKIDLPGGWLRGLMQVQAAMCLPLRRVTLTRDSVYSLLAWLKRHKAAKSPRALRFELVPGHAPRIVMEPWEQAVISQGPVYDGPPGAPTRVWGRQRLLVLARLLPLVERVDVYLLGTGLPSFWVAHMGEMRLTLGLSGWTANDWTRGATLDQLAPPASAVEGLIAAASSLLRQHRALTRTDARLRALAGPAETTVALNHLARTGQVIYDLSAGVYRFRQIMPRIVGEADLGPENPELLGAQDYVRRGLVKIDKTENAGALRVISGVVGGTPVELLLDGDGGIKRGKCNCSHHFKNGLRMGPCRHLLAVRSVVLDKGPSVNVNSWFARLQEWAGN